VRLPVTLLAKWKTTLQLTALGAEMLVACWGAFSLPDDPAFQSGVATGAHVLFWIACLVTLVTGAQYWEHAHKALRES
jgi:CDP-diacylglycerol--glycerol-3-phosphate 3-phosphatidyltransferase